MGSMAEISCTTKNKIEPVKDTEINCSLILLILSVISSIDFNFSLISLEVYLEN